MLRIGLTGPTGSGKSTVTALMRRWGGIEIWMPIPSPTG